MGRTLQCLIHIPEASRGPELRGGTTGSRCLSRSTEIYTRHRWPEVPNESDCRGQLSPFFKGHSPSHQEQVGRNFDCVVSVNSIILHHRTNLQKCLVASTGRKEMKLHMKHKHPQLESLKSFPCTQVDCRRGFETQYGLDQHLRPAHPLGGGSNCKFCPFAVCRNDLSRHFFKEHSMIPFTCELCTRQYQSPEYLAEHMLPQSKQEECSFRRRFPKSTKRAMHEWSAVERYNAGYVIRLTNASWNCIIRTRRTSHSHLHRLSDTPSRR